MGSMDDYSYYGEITEAAKPQAEKPNISPFAEPGKVTTADYRPAGADTGPMPLPAVEIYDKSRAVTTDQTGGRWPDAGKFEADPQKRVYKTTSTDGGKVREFTYDNPKSPEEITKIKIDGYREYFKTSEKSWDYYENGQLIGQWNGTVNMTRDGVYTFDGTREGQHSFGSAREEMTAADKAKYDQAKPGPKPPDAAPPADVVPPGTKPAGTTEVRPPTPTPSPTPDVVPPQPSPAIKPVSYEPDRPQPRPFKDDPVKPFELDKPPEAPEAKLAVQKVYETKDVELAMKVAAAKNLPIIMRVGSYKGCGPCRIMEDKVWPGLEEKNRGAAVFLHVDVDEIDPKTNPLAARIADNVESYPTMSKLTAHVTNGKVQYSEVTDSHNKPVVLIGGSSSEVTASKFGLKH